MQNNLLFLIETGKPLARSQSPDWERGEPSSSLAVLQEAGASKTGFPSWELGNQPSVSPCPEMANDSAMTHQSPRRAEGR